MEVFASVSKRFRKDMQGYASLGKATQGYLKFSKFAFNPAWQQQPLSRLDKKKLSPAPIRGILLAL